MRLLHQDPATGLLRLRIETPSDVWRIARFVRPGDPVGASTTRRDPEAPEETPGAQRDRRRVFLVVRSEQIEFHEFSKRLRITGPIVEGPFDLGRHHTLDLGEGDDLTITKSEITPADRILLEEGLHARGDPAILIAAVDWGASAVVRVRGRAVEPVAELNRTLSGKQYKAVQGEKDRASYIAELATLIAREAPAAQSVLVVGPGFLKEHVARALLEAHPDLKARLRVFPTAESGRTGVEELLRSGRASEALAGIAAAEESGLVEGLLGALGGGRRAAVGLREVAEAVEQGAAETLLVLESYLRDPAVTPILDRARGGRARLFVVREDGEAGRRLKGLGSIGAILRYDWAPRGGRGVAARPPEG
ncbi:MAG TPA: hypothetical protein VMH78_02950 [Thermoplasmata archaeon]|nr:hypothetical protein [Thermoplasmata archaeon]